MPASVGPVDRELDEARRAAETRLGRRLKGGELHLNLLADASALDDAKDRLRAAIEKEKLRTIRKVAGGGGFPGLDVTAEMENVLLDLHDAGVRAARAEIESMGLRPPTRLARRRARPWRIIGLVDELRKKLRGITVRVHDEAISAGLGNRVAGDLIRIVDRRAPGALDAASRLVSSAFTSGVATVYESAVELFAGWGYSAIMDGATCDDCEAHDGEEYDTLEAAYDVLPDFGPNPDCYGNGRCRCRLIPLGPAE